MTTHTLLGHSNLQGHTLRAAVLAQCAPAHLAHCTDPESSRSKTGRNLSRSSCPFFAPCFVGQDTRGMSTLRTPPTGQRNRKKHAPSDEPSGKAPRRPIWHPCAAEMWPAASGVCCRAGRRYAVILMKLISQEAPAQCSRFEGLITGVLHLLLHIPSSLPT